MSPNAVSRYMGRWRRGRLWTRLGLGGGGLWVLGGCAAAAGVAGAIAVGLLTGLFLTRLQASFAATQRSYAFTETGLADLSFVSPPGNPNSNILEFTGRLPGFHIVIVDIDVDDKAMPRSQAEESELFDTEVTIDPFTTPALTGTITPRNGGESMDLFDLYDIQDVNLVVREPDDEGRYRIEINILADTAEGGELDYTMLMRAGLSPDGSELEGELDVERIETLSDGTRIEINGDGVVEADKVEDD